MEKNGHIRILNRRVSFLLYNERTYTGSRDDNEDPRLPTSLKRVYNTVQIVKIQNLFRVPFSENVPVSLLVLVALVDVPATPRSRVEPLVPLTSDRDGRTPDPGSRRDLTRPWDPSKV